jgi:hypothetical protein
MTEVVVSELVLIGKGEGKAANHVSDEEVGAGIGNRLEDKNLEITDSDIPF